MPGRVAEQAAKVAVEVVSSLKATPVVLALVVFNCLFLILGFYEAGAERERWKGLVEAAMRWCPANTYPSEQQRQQGIPPQPPPR